MDDFGKWLLTLAIFAVVFLLGVARGADIVHGRLDRYGCEIYMEARDE